MDKTPEYPLLKVNLLNLNEIIKIKYPKKAMIKKFIAILKI